MTCELLRPRLPIFTIVLEPFIMKLLDETSSFHELNSCIFAVTAGHTNMKSTYKCCRVDEHPTNDRRNRTSPLSSSFSSTTSGTTSEESETMTDETGSDVVLDNQDCFEKVGGPMDIASLEQPSHQITILKAESNSIHTSITRVDSSSVIDNNCVDEYMPNYDIKASPLITSSLWGLIQSYCLNFISFVYNTLYLCLCMSLCICLVLSVAYFLSFVCFHNQCIFTSPCDRPFTLNSLSPLSAIYSVDYLYNLSSTINISVVSFFVLNCIEYPMYLLSVLHSLLPLIYDAVSFIPSYNLSLPLLTLFPSSFDAYSQPLTVQSVFPSLLLPKITFLTSFLSQSFAYSFLHYPIVCAIFSATSIIIICHIAITLFKTDSVKDTSIKRSNPHNAHPTIKDDQEIVVASLQEEIETWKQKYNELMDILAKKDQLLIDQRHFMANAAHDLKTVRFTYQ